jgi:hypothetical protein
MNKQLLRKAILLLAAMDFAVVAFAQTDFSAAGIKTILAQINQKLLDDARETVYIQFDKPYYETGDTLWYKAYVLNAATFTDTKNSGLLYIDINNDRNEAVRNFILPIAAGLGWGQVALNAIDFPPGNYSLKAYTNWMRNGPEEAFFSRQFYINGYNKNSWLVNSKVEFDKTADSAKLNIRLQNDSKQPLILQDIKVKVTNGNKTLLSSNTQTGVDGVARFNLSMPPKANGKQILLSVTENVKGDEKKRILMPLLINRPGNVDVQFMPEGGNLVAGLTWVVGFKALNEDGSGASLSGNVLNSANKVIATFKTQYNGMGHFIITPHTGESYIAKVNIDGMSRTFPLPGVKPAGTVLNIKSIGDTSALVVNICSSVANGTYYLVGQSRGIACYGGVVHLKGNSKIIHINKKVFPSGIARVSLLNAARQPLNERLVYINNHDNLRISITTNKATYNTRDSVALQFEVSDEDNKPVAGSFSVAVTDDGQVKTDSVLQGNMLTALLLNNGLKGNIETPGHYLEQSPAAMADLDNLLITQGWTTYNWNAIFAKPKDPDFIAQPQFTVVGRVKNVFGKPFSGTSVNLSSYSHHFVADTVTDANGLFVFENLPRLDTPRYTVRAYNRRGKAFNVDVQLYQTEPVRFAETNRILMPWNANVDSTIRDNASMMALIRQQEDVVNVNKNGQMLKEVKITDKKIIKGSHNLNGLGKADQIIDEKEIQKLGRVSLYDLIVKKVKGFSSSDGFKIYSQTLNFVFDGMFIGARDLTSAFTITYLLNNYTADDILGIEVMNNMAYSAFYNMKYRPGEVIHYTLSGNLNPAYIEITTRKGLGSFIDTAPGVVSYSSIPVQWYPKQFYSPKYGLKRMVLPGVSDHRSTILWVPNLSTKKDGKATASFYTSDMKGRYTITAEGCDLDGRLGSITATLKIE